MSSIRKSLLFFISFIALLTASNSAKACDVINGSDIIYTWLGGKRYAIKYILYHQCVCKLSILPTFTASSGGNTTNTAAKRVSIRDITLICSSDFPPCLSSGGSSGGRYGIEEHIFVDTLDFAKAPYSNWLKNNCTIRLRVQQPWGLIGTTTSTTTYGGQCEINLCNIGTKGNNSPTFANIPMTFMCCNLPFTFNNGASDLKDGDSLSFEMDEPLSSNFIPVTWKSPWSKSKPLTPYCPPNPGKVDCKPVPTATPPRGFYFDSMLGDIILTPTNCTESGPISIRITEWRHDSTGKWVQLGYTRRDIYVNVIDCGYNNPPTIDAKQIWKVCEGDKLCFTIKSKDVAFSPHQKVGDTTTLTWSKTIAGATFTILDSTVREREAEFCWQTKVGQARPNPYTFTAKAMDDFCPTPGQAIKGFSIYVKIKATAKREYQNLACGKFVFNSVAANNIPGNPLYKWSFRDISGNEFAFSSKKSDTLVFKKGQRIIIVHTINTSDNCPSIYRDTWDIPSPPEVFLATADTFACLYTGIKLEANILFAKLPYKYYWTRPLDHTAGDTFKTLSIPMIDRDSVIMVRVTDANQCVFYDTATVFMKPLPALPSMPDQRICTYQTATFDALHADTMFYNWNSGDTTRTITKHIAGDYIVKITDTIWGCQMIDTVHLFVNDTAKSVAGKDIAYCQNDKYTINASHNPGIHSATYQWRDIKSGTVLGSNASYLVSPKNTNPAGGAPQFFSYELFAQVTQGGVTCENYDTMTIRVNTLPDVRWTKNPLDPRCHDFGDITLNPFVTAPLSNLRKSGNFRIWGTTTGYGFKSGNNNNGIIDSQLADRHVFRTTKINNNTTLSGGKFLEDNLTVWFKDTNGCVNTASTKQRINGNPVILLDTSIYCQDKGWAKLDSSVIRPKVKFGTKQLWEILQVPSGVNPGLVVVDVSGGSGLDWELQFGTVSEDFYAGDYKLKFSVTDAITGCFAVDTTMVKIIPEPTVKVTPPPQACLNWDTMDLRNNILLNGSKPVINIHNKFSIQEYRYDRNDPKVSSTKLDKGYLFTPSSGAGAWLVKFSSDETGCLKEDSFYIFVNDTPSTTLLSPITLCSSGPDLDLDTRATNVQPSSAVLAWSGQNVTGRFFKPLSTGTSSLEGPYNLSLLLTDNNGCLGHYNYPVTVRSQPTVSITSPKPMQGCVGTPFNIKSTSKFANGIVWTKINGAGGTISNVNSPDMTYQDGGIDATNQYAWVKITTLPIAGEVCPQVSDSVQMLLFIYPEVDMQNPASGCVPLSADFIGIENKGIAANSLSWAWDFGNGITSTNQNPTGIVFPNQGKYTVTLTVTNTAGPCPSNKINVDYVNVYPLPVAGFVTDPTKTTIALPRFTMDNRSTLDKSVFANGSMTYQWDFDDPVTDPNDTSTFQNPRYSYGKDTNDYDITLIVTSNYGCKDTFTQRVVIGPDIIVFIPDVFTPDGAGPNRNNTFMISALNFKTMKMLVFNRWGELLYETTDPAKGWDGYANGVLCADGVYVYKVEVTSADGKVFKYDGTVTLLR